MLKKGEPIDIDPTPEQEQEANAHNAYLTSRPLQIMELLKDDPRSRTAIEKMIPKKLALAFSDPRVLEHFLRNAAMQVANDEFHDCVELDWEDVVMGMKKYIADPQVRADCLSSAQTEVRIAEFKARG
jgi:hypothetical protein